MQARIDTPDYWIDSYKPTDADLEFLAGHLAAHTQPHGIEALSSRVVTNRIKLEVKAREARIKAKGTVYQPAERYEKGQELVFSAMGNSKAKVKAVRPGNNPAYGSYEVITVDIGGASREFASGLTWEHHLSQTELNLDPVSLAERFAPVIAPQLAARLKDDPGWLSYGDRWIPQSLLPEINQGHTNLAEAIIMLAGEPLPAVQILNDLDIDKSIPEETRSIALELALSSDERFRNVGALEAPLWTLKAQL